MKDLTEIRNTVQQALRIIEEENQSEIRLGANGGNSILIVCQPEEEKNYINVLSEAIKNNNNYQIINLNKILISYINENKENLIESFNLLQSSLYQIFKSPEGDPTDLYNYILGIIKEAFENKKVPVLINTGALYGTGIENIHFMESDVVMNAGKPLVILYPATHKEERLMFLNSRPASKYRCLIVE